MAAAPTSTPSSIDPVLGRLIGSIDQTRVVWTKPDYGVVIFFSPFCATCVGWHNLRNRENRIAAVRQIPWPVLRTANRQQDRSSDGRWYGGLLDDRILISETVGPLELLETVELL